MMTDKPWRDVIREVDTLRARIAELEKAAERHKKEIDWYQAWITALNNKIEMMEADKTQLTE